MICKYLEKTDVCNLLMTIVTEKCRSCTGNTVGIVRGNVLEIRDVVTQKTREETYF